MDGWWASEEDWPWYTGMAYFGDEKLAVIGLFGVPNGPAQMLFFCVYMYVRMCIVWDLPGFRNVCLLIYFVNVVCCCFVNQVIHLLS